MDITNHSIPILNNIVSAPKFTSPTTKKLSELESHTVDFIKKHPNVIYTHADKGNVTVALDKDVYVSNMNSLFSDSNTYEIIKKDPTKKLTSSLRVMLTEWKNKDYIDGSEYRKLYCSDGMLPRAYGLPKIHKPDCPLRIIVSSIGSPLHSLASFLHEILYETIPVADSNIKNSFKLIEKLKCFNNADGFELISLDVVSLFTNVPIDIALDCIDEQWCYISRGCPLPREEFQKAIKFVLESTFFVFDNKTYRQYFGTPMGSPLSPIIADLVMRRLETVTLPPFRGDLLFYFRYVDDVCMAILAEKIDTLFQAFNSFHPRLQFTLEIGGDKLNFLDTTISKINNTFIFYWYRKPTKQLFW
ncbi:PREDICTED: uncharacterized protein LOC108777557 [Cyphomyrmex costatus]|uniref:uncharacterized protein LOC108777557 n=1 Tax=Cyphomyrmex costatus TaxID=456900 RepID=UPI0008522BAF|nr:PREDICTED: uncharacterized protein LOC108777557 [Cyphomyrmex costatus]